MQVPELPHDNLYKFVAFAGLAIILFVNYLFFTKTVELSDDYTKLAGDFKALIAIYEPLESRAAVVRGQLDKANRPGGPPMSGEEIRTAVEQIKRDVQPFELKRIELETRKELLELKEADLLLIRVTHKTGSLVGLVMLIIGIILWYVRVQGPNDLLIKASLKGYRRNRAPRLKN